MTPTGKISWRAISKRPKNSKIIFFLFANHGEQDRLQLEFFNGNISCTISADPAGDASRMSYVRQERVSKEQIAEAGRECE